MFLSPAKLLIFHLNSCSQFWGTLYNSGKAKFIAEGGKVGRKVGYKKPDEKLQEEYAGVIKMLRKGYPVRMIAKNEGVGISTVMRIKKKFNIN